MPIVTLTCDLQNQKGLFWALTMDNMSAKFEEAHNGLVSIVFTSLFLYMSIVTSDLKNQWGSSSPYGYRVCQVSWRSTQQFSLYLVHKLKKKLISIYVNCDLDLWPPKSIGFILSSLWTCMPSLMNRHNSLVSIVFTRSKRDGHTHTHGRNHSNVTISPPQRVARE